LIEFGTSNAISYSTRACGRDLFATHLVHHLPFMDTKLHQHGVIKKSSVVESMVDAYCMLFGRGYQGSEAEVAVSSPTKVLPRS